jgi:Rod binding domain-containing protein
VTGPADGIALAGAAAADARLEALRRGGEREGRVAAAVELQALFLTELLRALRRTVPESDFLPRSPARDVYEGVFDRSVAEALAGRDPLGLVRILAGPLPQDSAPPGR